MHGIPHLQLQQLPHTIMIGDRRSPAAFSIATTFLAHALQVVESLIGTVRYGTVRYDGLQ